MRYRRCWRRGVLGTCATLDAEALWSAPAATGRHRSVGFSELLIASIAERHHLAVLHYDADFEIAATVLDFAHVWVAERGSLWTGVTISRARTLPQGVV